LHNIEIRKINFICCCFAIFSKNSCFKIFEKSAVLTANFLALIAGEIPE